MEEAQDHTSERETELELNQPLRDGGQGAEENSETSNNNTPQPLQQEFIFTLDDKEYRVPKTAKMKLRDSEVSAEELEKELWGRQGISRKFNELETIKRNEIEPKKQIIEFYDNLSRNLNTLQGREKVQYLLEEFGRIDPDLLQSLPEYNKSLVEEAYQYAQLSEDQRKAYMLEKENNHLKQTQKQFEQDQFSNYATQQLSHLTEKLKGEYKVSDDQLNSIAQQLEQTGAIKHNMGLPARLGLFEDSVKNYYAVNMALNALESIDPELINDSDMAMDLIQYQLRTNSRDVEELKTRALRLWGDDKKIAELQQKAKKNSKVTGMSNQPHHSEKTNFSPKKTKETPKERVERFRRERNIIL